MADIKRQNGILNTKGFTFFVLLCETKHYCANHKDIIWLNLNKTCD